jgi:hypothetical protein
VEVRSQQLLSVCAVVKCAVKCAVKCEFYLSVCVAKYNITGEDDGNWRSMLLTKPKVLYATN